MMNRMGIKLALGFLLILGCALLAFGLAALRYLPARGREVIVAQEWWPFLAAASLVFVVSIAAVLVLVRGITHPLGELADVARRLSQGNWGSRVKHPAADELGDLACSLNNLSARIRKTVGDLEESRGQLEAVLTHMGSGVLLVDDGGCIVMVNPVAEEILGIRQEEVRGRSQVEVVRNYSLSQLISEVLGEWRPQRREISLIYPEERILEATAAPVCGEGRERRGVLVVLYDITEIRRLERVRAEFVANVSHELKTPVTSIKGFAETLLEGALYNHRAAEEFVSIINEEAERLSRLIQDLLELSRIESREVKPQPENLDLTVEIKEIVDRLQPRFRKKGLELSTGLPPEAVYVRADRDHLEQILSNLLDNALKYTPEGGRVTVGLLPGEIEVIVVVEDTGIGIPAEDLPRIFERFYRVDKARSRKLGGTGLGLAIVKHLVNANGGRVWVESEPGRGSRFYFSLPAVEGVGETGIYGRDKI